MSKERIFKTSLWANALKERGHDEHSELREELRSSFLKFRENTSHLVTQIAKQLPGLTQHEISHLDALWEVGSLICGDNYLLNPLEAFVFGGAVLLHDSALCFEAYDNGIIGVRDTITWKDSYSIAKEEGNNISDDACKAIADFSALRYLHSKQAEKLTEKSWLDPETNQPIFLIENVNLRKHLGVLIGQIAASHHWDIDEVASRLHSQVNAPNPFPIEWRIDPIKIACLLRCSDAAHLDNERAPDFLHALIKRQGISLKHWQAQNKLARVDLDKSDESKSTIIFMSTRSFPESESDAWWIAYDSACIVDKEIRSSNALLAPRLGLNNQFQVKKVKGIESPEIMSKLVTTDGWTPTRAEIHVGNIEGLVKSLGGEKLYGAGCDKLHVVVRELIQNARDSIQARRALDPSYEGKITVKLSKVEDKNWLFVEDDGVGMTKRVLTGPLLDFGTSFWASSLVQNEFPGLKSSKFKPIGKFGIGFFSIFMIASEVCVTSKPWLGGASDINQLHFKNGLSFRPLLKNKVPNNFSMAISTQIAIKLNDNIIPNENLIEIKRNTLGSKNFTVPIEDLISAICAGLDVPVYFNDNKNMNIKIHTGNINDSNKKEWLHKISFSKYQGESFASEYIEANADRLRPIIENGICLGFAAISTCGNNMQNFLGTRTVGGLACTVHSRNGDNYIGYIDFQPQSATREGNVYSASDSTIKAWAEEQVKIICRSTLQPFDRHILATSLCAFKVDPIEIATLVVAINKKLQIVTFEELAQLASKMEIVILKSKYMDHAEIHHDTEFLDGKALIRPLKNGAFLSLKMIAGIPENNFSIIDCLHRTLVKQGKIPIWRLDLNIGKSSLGVMDALVVTVQKIKDK